MVDGKDWEEALLQSLTGASLCHSFTPAPLKRSNPGAS
jgi:hypothetical protein